MPEPMPSLNISKSSFSSLRMDIVSPLAGLPCIACPAEPMSALSLCRRLRLGMLSLSIALPMPHICSAIPSASEPGACRASSLATSAVHFSFSLVKLSSLAAVLFARHIRIAAVSMAISANMDANVPSSRAETHMSSISSAISPFSPLFSLLPLMYAQSAAYALFIAAERGTITASAHRPRTKPYTLCAYMNGSGSAQADMLTAYLIYTGVSMPFLEQCMSISSAMPAITRQEERLI